MSSIMLIVIFCSFFNCELTAKLISSLDVDNFPYLIHIVHSQKRSGCSGTIISPNWILTSATCLADNDTKTNISYVVNCDNFTIIPVTTLKENRETQYLCPSYYVIHNNFVSATNENDIAMIKLAQPIDSKYAKIIPLANETDYMNSLQKKGKLVNFIQDYKPETKQLVEETLIKAINENEVTVIDSETCKEKLSGVIEDQDVCSLYSPEDPCTDDGDIGGPLLVNNVQIGVTTFGIKCNPPKEGVVHTRVDKHLKWIQNQWSPVEWEPRGAAETKNSAIILHSSFTLLLVLLVLFYFMF